MIRRIFLSRIAGHDFTPLINRFVNVTEPQPLVSLSRGRQDFVGPKLAVIF